MALQLCQLIHVQTIHCVNSANCLLSNQPRAFFPVILVYQHSLTMRLHPGLLPSPEGRAHRHSQDSSSRRFSCRGLVQVIAKMPTSHCSQCNSMHVACLSCSSSSLFSRHGPFTVPIAQSRLPLQKVAISFAHRLNQFRQVSQFFQFCRSWRRLVRFATYLPSSCAGVWDPWSVKYQILNIGNDVVALKQRMASFQHLHYFRCIFLDTEISILYLFTPKRSRVHKFRAWSCSNLT